MDWKKQLRNPIIQQYGLELLLPLAGYVFFDWSIPVIIAFFFIDYFCSEIARQRRHFKIKQHWNGEMKWFLIGLIVASLLFAGLTIFTWKWLFDLDPQSHVHTAEITEFFQAEGWFLIPLVYLANYMKDVMTFYAPRRFAKYNFIKTIKMYLIEITIFTLLVIAGLIAWSQFQIPDVPALIGFVVVKLVFDLVLVQQLKKIAQQA